MIFHYSKFDAADSGLTLTTNSEGMRGSLEFNSFSIFEGIHYVDSNGLGFNGFWNLDDKKGGCDNTESIFLLINFSKYVVFLVINIRTMIARLLWDPDCVDGIINR